MRGISSVASRNNPVKYTDPDGNSSTVSFVLKAGACIIKISTVLLEKAESNVKVKQSNKVNKNDKI